MQIRDLTRVHAVAHFSSYWIQEKQRCYILVTYCWTLDGEIECNGLGEKKSLLGGEVLLDTEADGTRRELSLKKLTAELTATKIKRLCGMKEVKIYGTGRNL